jgi:GH43 family beta-xylosidase
MLRSRDLVHWEIAGGALEPLSGDLTASPQDYWAPEITYHNGIFYLYYSAGIELTGMRLRVATSDRPQGPYRDSGRELTPGPFAIDPHVFIDDEGGWWMFYATDFLQHTRAGTGTVLDRMVDPYTLEGNPRPVSRARYEWQVYDLARVEKGGAKWHTIEGSFVLKRKGRYYQMFSGGNWTNPTYGVGYAVTRDMNTTEEWEQPLDGLEAPLLMRTIPDTVVGPGHNSVVRGPDNLQPFCVYHRWEEGSRLLCIDRLDFAGERLTVLGPSHTPQPAPNMPTDVEISPEAGDEWELTTPHVVFETTLRAERAENGWYGVRLTGGRRQVVTAGIRIRDRALVLRSGRAEEHLPLPPYFNPAADHLLRMEVDGVRWRIMLDNAASRWDVRLPFEPSALTLFDERAGASFCAVELTAGWEELFEGPEETAEELGWQGDAGWHVAGGELVSPQQGSDSTMVAKETPGGEYEMVVNARLVSAQDEGGYGFVLALTPQHTGPMVTLGQQGESWELTAGNERHEESWRLPPAFDPLQTQQWRFRAEGDKVTVSWEGMTLGKLPLQEPGQFVGLAASHAVIAVEMVRVVALSRQL